MQYDLVNLKNRAAEIDDSDLKFHFSVFVPIIKSKDQGSVLFEVRSDSLSKQPSEICFPGGKIEPGESKTEAAIRETSEELLVPQCSIDLIGELDTVVTPFNTIIYPFTGFINDYSGTFNNSEVKEVFLVPLEYFYNSKPDCYYIDVEITPRDSFPFELIQNGRDYHWAKGKYPVYFYKFEDKIIWGITARIMYNFVKLVKAL